MRTRSRARATRTHVLPLGPDEVQLVLSRLGATDLRRAAATCKMWRERTAPHFVDPEWQARSCALRTLLRRPEALPEATRLHIETLVAAARKVASKSSGSGELFRLTGQIMSECIELDGK
eukprot:4256821-Prymnesium_polylepis.1